MDPELLENTDAGTIADQGSRNPGTQTCTRNIQHEEEDPLRRAQQFSAEMTETTRFLLVKAALLCED